MMTRPNPVLISVGLACALILAPRDLPAGEEPYMSVRTGLRCSQCHVNRTGGGGRNSFGVVYAQTRLGMRNFGFRNRMLNDFVSVGGNFRLVAPGPPTESGPRTAAGVAAADLPPEVPLLPD